MKNDIIRKFLSVHKCAKKKKKKKCTNIFLKNIIHGIKMKKKKKNKIATTIQIGLNETWYAHKMSSEINTYIIRTCINAYNYILNFLHFRTKVNLSLFPGEVSFFYCSSIYFFSFFLFFLLLQCMT